MTMAQTRRILYDLALTVEVHPMALGVIPESNGQVTLPEQIKIEATVVTDIIRYHQEDTKEGEFVGRRVFEPSQTADIPPLVRDLRIVGKGKKGKAKPRAVVVVEHRNLKMVLTHHDFADGKIILIMVSRAHSLRSKLIANSHADFQRRNPRISAHAGKRPCPVRRSLPLHI